MADNNKVFSTAAAAAASAVPTHLHSMASLLKPQKPSDPLPPDFEPGPLDVCSGRGKRNWNHSGNVAFRHRIQSQVEAYINAPTKNQKTAIVCTIVDEMRQQGCRFLQQNKQGRWYDIGDAKARDKVGHGLRDQVTAINRGQASPPPPSEKQPMVLTTSLSDSEGEENMRRRSASADQITQFARRPSWIAEENSSASAQMDGIPVAEFEQQRRSSSSVGWSMLLQDDGNMLQELMDLDISHNAIDNLVDSGNPAYEQYNSNVAYPSQQQQLQPQTQQHYQPQPQQQHPQQYPQQQPQQQQEYQPPQQHLQQQPQQQQQQQQQSTTVSATATTGAAPARTSWIRRQQHGIGRGRRRHFRLHTATTAVPASGANRDRFYQSPERQLEIVGFPRFPRHIVWVGAHGRHDH